jgi:hypothetical protein
MKGIVWSFGVAVVAGGFVAIFVVALGPIEAAHVLDAYLLFVGAVTLLALVRTTSVAQPGSRESPFELALRPGKPRTERPPELERLERQVALAATTAFDVHYRLRPIVREIATQRLWARHAVDLEADTDRAELLLGAEVWGLARPDRPPPSDPFARGLGLQGIETVITELERS